VELCIHWMCHLHASTRAVEERSAEPSTLEDEVAAAAGNALRG
jgi:hypothetical protein